jgi:creatinine amidohydrolase
MIHDWDLTETNLGRLSGRRIEVAILSTAAIEPHNRHLPEGQDFLHTSHIARTVADRASRADASVICLPTLPFGVDCNLMDFPLAVHVSQRNLDAMLEDIIGSLLHHGIRKFVLINGHGGNDFIPLTRSIQAALAVHLFVCDWWKVGSDRYGSIFEQADDHAGELETSVALALFPHLVEMEQAGSGLVPPFRFEALNRGWLRTSRRFSKLNDHCAAGDPSKASADKGRAYLDLVVDRISDFVVQLAAEELDGYFPMAQFNPS